MRSIYTKGAVTLATAFALCALVAVSASAAEWYVGGKALTGSEKLATTVTVEQPIVVSIPAIEFKFTCTAASDSASEIGAKTSFKVHYFRLEGCKTTMPAKGCEMESPEIPFYLDEGVLTKGTAPEDKLKLQPQTKGHELGEIPFGSACGLGPAGQPMYGAVTLNMIKGQEESAEQTFEGQGTKESPSELVTFSRTGEATYITGKLKLKLASGKAWSFH
jgi:hypothetical protein